MPWLAVYNTSSRRLDVQLLEGVKEVVSYRVIAKMERLCEVVVAQAFGNLPHHRLPFASAPDLYGAALL